MNLKLFLVVILLSISLPAYAQNAITGLVKNYENKPVGAVTISLLKSTDSSLIKVGVTNQEGYFEIPVTGGRYLLSYSSLGFEKVFSGVFTVPEGENYTAPEIRLMPAVNNLKDVTIIAARKPMIEVHTDKMVFNVENSINGVGSNALELLQKSPGVMVDNSDNINMKGKSGVKIYIDGKMSQLTAGDLSEYLKSLSSNDIETIEIISNPGAKYEASGNGGIINIRLKKNKKRGINGNASIGYIQGETPKENGAVSLNYRNGKINLFSNVTGTWGYYHQNLGLYRIQNDSIYDGKTNSVRKRNIVNVKAGMDYLKNSKNTFGFLVTTSYTDGLNSTKSNTRIYYQPTNQFIKTLLARNLAPLTRSYTDFNVNYRYADSTGREVSFDADYGLYHSTGTSYQPNSYYDNNDQFLYSINTSNNTPTRINIYTTQLDIEQPLGTGKIGYGAKFSYVNTENNFDLYNVIGDEYKKDPSQSNKFDYTENINAAYINYDNRINTQWTFYAGIRVEQTNSKGVLTRSDGTVQPDNSVKRNYLNFFPNASIDYTLNDQHTFKLAYNRRIDRPNYQDLNPFESKFDELTYLKGNAFLRPQYTNNIELSHNFKSTIVTAISYSHIKDYVIEIIDTSRGNATYYQDRNLATQQVLNFNVSSPLTINSWWDGYISVSCFLQQLKGTYNNTTIDDTSPGYNINLQNSFSLGKDYMAEVSGWVQRPGFNGSWKSTAFGDVDLGLQKQFLEKKATIKLSVTDIFKTYHYKLTNDYGATYFVINNRRESQTFRLNFSYRFGSSKMKAAPQRKTSMESESNRIN